MGKTEINGNGRRLDLGGEHTIQYRDEIIWKCTLKTYIVVFTKVTPVNSIKNFKKTTSCYLKYYLSKKELKYIFMIRIRLDGMWKTQNYT